MTRLLTAIKTSKQSANLDINRLGVTHGIIEMHRRKLTASAHPLTDTTILGILRDRLLARSNLIHCRMRVAISGADLNVRMESTAQGPGMLPWHVTVGRDTWNTYSMDLPEVLALWVGSRPTLPHLLRPDDFVQNEFWNELLNLEEPLEKVKMPKLPSSKQGEIKHSIRQQLR